MMIAGWFCRVWAGQRGCSQRLAAIASLVVIGLALAFPAPCSAGDGQKLPLKVFILAGQSNMQGHAHVRTIPAMALSPKTAAIMKDIVNPDGSYRVCERVWISCIGCGPQELVGRLTVGFGAQGRGPKFGPEWTFGIYMEKLIPNPILIIKTAWGGKSLHTDFRPPGAGPYQFNEAQLERLRRQGKDIEAERARKAEATGRYYRLMIEHVRKVLADPGRVCPAYDPEQGYELAGFVWFQGWNDMIDGGTYPDRGQPGGYRLYTELLAQLIRDVRQDLQAPDLPFVIGVMGVGGPVDQYGPEKQRYKAVHQNFRLAQAAPASMPEFRGTVAAVLTEQFWDMEVEALRKRERELRPQIEEINRKARAGMISREEAQEAIQKIYERAFTPRELTLLKESVSNGDYHYMGSARIMTQIGKAFAEAMFDLMQKRTKQ